MQIYLAKIDRFRADLNADVLCSGLYRKGVSCVVIGSPPALTDQNGLKKKIGAVLSKTICHFSLSLLSLSNAL